jgi:hypothetical protein
MAADEITDPIMQVSRAPNLAHLFFSKFFEMGAVSTAETIRYSIRDRMRFIIPRIKKNRCNPWASLIVL